MNERSSKTTAPQRRDVLRQLGAVALGGLAGTPALAQQQYPTRPITMILPSAPGVPSDLIGRKIASLMAAQAGVPIVADNRAGANGVIGVQALLRAPADGYNVLFTTTSTMATNKAMIKDLPYEPLKDLTAIGFGFRTWLMVSINAKLPFKTIQELIAYAKANPGKLNFGYGTANPQLGGKMFEQLTGARFTFVPYKAHSAMVLALTTGEVDVTVTDTLSLGAFIKAGSVRVLAAMSPHRLAAMPDLPTMGELGLPSAEMLSAHIFMVKAGTPPDAVAKLTQLLKAAAESKEFKDWIPTTGFDSYLVTGAQASQENAKEIERIGTIARNAGLQPT
ncbi:MAG TPA: tripartite tricarboxylate transporter substrate binding protein [Ramlibacter sp.]|nr:tripartite tricarboxylate transporter substrate binding protein [Ramlibacter sp.]